MHLVFSRTSSCLEGIEAGAVDEYKLAGLLGMTVTEGPMLPGPVLKGHWRGFTVEISDARRVMQEPEELIALFPQPKEFTITFHLLKSSDVEIGIRHRALEAVGALRPQLPGNRKVHMPPEFGRDYQVMGPSARVVKYIIDPDLQNLIYRLGQHGAPEITIEYSILTYRGAGNYLDRYRDLPLILGCLVEIARQLDGKLTVGLSNPASKFPA